MSSKLTNLIKFLFISRFDVYAVQTKTGYISIKEPLSDELIDKHLRGELTLGVYQLDEESKIKWICFDFDKVEGEKISKAIEFLKNSKRFEKSFLLEDTGGRGIHLWIFFNPKISARAGRAFALQISKKFEFNCEIFPKQTEISEGELGNLVKLPLGVHQKYGEFSFLIEPISLDEIIPADISDLESQLEDWLFQKEEKFYIDEKAYIAGLIPWWAKCKAFDRIINAFVEPGSRNECGFWLCRLLRNSCFPRWMTEAILLLWNSKLREPLSENEIKNIVKSVYSKGYAVGNLSLIKNPITSMYCDGCLEKVCIEESKKKKSKSEKSKDKKKKILVRGDAEV